MELKLRICHSYNLLLSLVLTYIYIYNLYICVYLNSTHEIYFEKL